MVKFSQGRSDADEVLLKKTVTYNSYTFTKHPIYGTYTNKTAVSVSIKAQVRPAQLGDKLVKQGKLKTSDCYGVLRYQYTAEADGTEITPTITPKEDDEIVYNNKLYRVSELTSIFDEDGILMWFDCKLVYISDE